MKKFLKSIWNEFIYGGHLLALCSVIAIFLTLILLGLPLSYRLLICWYLIAYSSLLYDRYKDVSEESSADRLTLIYSHRKAIPFLIAIPLIISSLILFLQSYTVIIFAVILALFGFLYSVIFKKFTKSIVGYKSFFVALTFSLVVFMPFFYYNIKIDLRVLYLYVFFLLRWFVNTTFCDLKDKTVDRNSGLKTFAVALSPNKFDKLVLFANIFSVTPIFLGVISHSLPVKSLLLVTTLFYFQIYFTLSKRNGDKIQTYCNVWADGECILWLLIGILLLRL